MNTELIIFFVLVQCFKTLIKELLNLPGEKECKTKQNKTPCVAVLSVYEVCLKRNIIDF